jgi:hypothetical protein
MTTLLRTRDAVLEYLNTAFDDNFENHDLIERHIWTYQASNGTGLYQNNKSLNFTFHGQIGTNVQARTYDDYETGELVAEFSKTTIANRKRYQMVHTVRKTGDTYSLVTYWEFLYESFLANMNKMRGNFSYQKAIEFSEKENPTDEEIAEVMATIVYVGVNDTPVGPVKEITLDVQIEEVFNNVHIKGVYKVDGVEATPLRYFWFIDPVNKVPGLDTQPAAGGESITVSEFDLSTDFRDRTKYTIMRSDAVRVRCFCQYLDNKELKQVTYDKVHNFSEYLPVFDYFGLPS